MCYSDLDSIPGYRVIPTQSKEYDFIVIGGGLAGVCAGIAAARHDCRTALVQDRPVLGGNSSSEIRMHVCGAAAVNDGRERRETGIIEELRLANTARNPQHSSSMWDLLLYEWVKREPHLDLYLNSLAFEPLMANPERIKAIRIRQLGSEHEFLLRASLFADCSGDGQIAAQAGADFRRGREAAEETGESLAGSIGDAFCMGSSLLFMARDMGRPMPFIKPDWAHTYPTEDSLCNRPHYQYGYGYWWIEWGGELDTVRDNETIRDELLKIVLGVWDHIKNHGDHGAENWALDWVGFVPGKRESRRFMGDHLLCQQDVENGRLFDDAVAYGGWPIDLHPVRGIQDSGSPNIEVTVPLYSIPLRSLYSRNIANLFFAGRNISATHVALASTRVMTTCAVMGQAVGVTAAVCAKKSLSPRQAAKEEIATIQQLLLADDCYLPGQCNTDPLDLARAATITAGSNAEGMPPTAIIDGVARGVDSAPHCWESSPLAQQEAWIKLHWLAPVSIRRLQLTFDSELEKRLILTHETDLYTLDQFLEQIPQRLVKTFEIQFLHNHKWHSARSVTNNIQRHRIENFDPPLSTNAVRIIIKETYGHPTARLFEIRAYA